MCIYVQNRYVKFQSDFLKEYKSERSKHNFKGQTCRINMLQANECY